MRRSVLTVQTFTGHGPRTWEEEAEGGCCAARHQECAEAMSPRVCSSASQSAELPECQYSAATLCQGCKNIAVLDSEKADFAVFESYQVILA